MRKSALAYVAAVGNPWCKIHLDTFHMNIEEADLGTSIRAAGALVRDVHLADSHRLWPGTGHTDFRPGFAEEIGYPIVLKLFSETITHKTDVGGVQLNIRTPEGVRSAYQAISAQVPGVTGSGGNEAGGGLELLDVFGGPGHLDGDRVGGEEDRGAGDLGQGGADGFRIGPDEAVVVVEVAELFAGGGAGADGDDFAFLRLFLSAVRDDDPASGFRFGLDTTDEDTVMQRTKFHDMPSFYG